MKKMFLLVTIAGLSSSALASLSLDGRTDYTSASSNSQYSSNTTGASAFLFNRLKMVGDVKMPRSLTLNFSTNLMAFSKDLLTSNGNTAGGAYDSTSGNAVTKLGPVNPLATGASLSGLPTTGPTDFIDYAEANQKVNDSISFKVGKLQNSGFGGFESQDNLGDMYFSSQGYMGQTYLTGGGVFYQIVEGQSVEVYMVNNTNTTDYTRLGGNFAYKGKFGNFGVVANYGILPQGNQTGTSNPINATIINVGLRYSMMDWTFTADYDANTNFGNTFWNQKYDYLSSVSTSKPLAYQSLNSSGTLAYNGLAFGTNNNTLQNSVVLQAKYKTGNWTPWAKLEFTNRSGYQTSGTNVANNQFSDANDNITNWSLAAEYSEDKSNFRYYVAYVNSTTNYDSSTKYQTVANPVSASISSTLNGTGTGFNSTVNASYAFVGLRYMGEFLK